MQDQDKTEIFEAERNRLFSLAYRMLGSVADAEDMVQDSFVRWCQSSLDEIHNPQGFLTTIVTRLSLDHLRSAKTKRTSYVGSWLPEPLLTETAESPDNITQKADDISFALMATLEKLTAPERAAFLLHDVFDLPFDQIAKTLERSEASCRKLASRARQKVRSDGDETLPRPADDPLISSFMTALQTGDLDSFVSFIAEDAVLVTDGGGIKSATLLPIYGREKITRFFVGVAKKFGRPGAEDIKLTTINGAPGFIIRDEEGDVQAWSFSWTPDNKVAEFYILRNPEKLAHITFEQTKAAL
ncbi:sigma-70 family RNA polymerase sigma factor [Maritalea mediterranea]|uniref:Sigma-70 family RNA polymerase sigma factor n=1 Tax=Maritalea mediterranea TaxID=2909667 RepID=A0ABS9E8P1_9HYPH|nr:sigma-70 family RNA polymerase sigma factor [Maritalea mediterranea]MCF4099244.1 sigma-70 family RNA polymerase sigma factor [Maritalea mediterranea]